jgi:hypothetical protein
MFGLLRRLAGKPTQTTSAPRFARLRLESLEARQVPATLTLSVTYGTGKMVTLSGTLSGVDNPSLQMITLGGQVQDTIFTNSMGQFSVTESAMTLGDVTATYVPMSMFASGSTSASSSMFNSGTTASVTLTDVTPSLTFCAHEYPGSVWVLSGDVTYSRGPGSLPVYFGGRPVSLSGQTATTNSSGHYETTVYLNGTSSDNGIATAVVYTPWNTPSEEALTYVHQSGT